MRTTFSDAGRAGLAGAVTFLGLAALLAAPGCAKKKAEVKAEVPVRVVRVEERDIRRCLDYAANLAAQDEANVYPKVTGKILEKVKEDGARVAKGDVIAYVDRDEVGLKFEKAPVESPLAGVVGRVYVDRGASVTPQTPVALVVNMENMRVRLDVPEKYLPAVSVGQAAEMSVDAWPGQIFIGKIVKVSPVVDIATRTAPVEIWLANADARLKPGMFCRAKLVLEEKKNVPVVPKEAVMGKAPATFVYVVEKGVAKERAIRLGIRDGADYEVLEGIRQGDSVVVLGQQRLRDGLAVRLESDDQARKGDRPASAEKRRNG